MAKEFRMGARMTLKDNFTSAVSKMGQTTMGFKKTVDNVNKSVGTYRDSLGRLHNEQGRYVTEGNKADVRARTWIGTNGKLSSSFGLVTRGVQAAATAFGLMKAKDWLIDSNANMETYQNTLTVVLKDQKKAVDMMAWAADFAAKTPFEIPQIVEATTKLTSYGMNAQKTLGIVGDMASAMGKDVMQAVEAVADAQTGQLERMLEFGVTKKMIEDQAKLMKLTVTNNQGQITDQKAFNAALFKLMEDRFKGAMDIQSKSFWGILSNIKDFMGTSLRELGKPLFDKVKAGMQSVLDWLQRLKDNGSLAAFMNRVNDIGSRIFSIFGEVKTFVTDVIGKIISKVTEWYNNNKTKIDAVGMAFQNAFAKLVEFAGPIINWLKDVGLPAITGALMDICLWVGNVAKWFIDNWKGIGPIVMGIAGGILAYVAYIKIAAAVTKAWTAIQMAFNAVMNMNPVGLIIMAIVILIGVIVAVVKNWDTVKAALIAGAKAVGDFFVRIWTWIKTTAISVWESIVGAFNSAWEFIAGVGQSIGDFFVGIWTGIVDGVNVAIGWLVSAWQGFKDFFGNLWTGIMEIVKAPVNFLIEAINLLVRGLNSISIDIPDWVPLVGGKKFGFAIPEIPYLAKGTNNWQGGPAFMNERGGELAVLPGGSQVIPADKTDKILDKPSKPPVIIKIEKIEINQQPGEDGERLASRVVNVLYNKLSMAAEIANNDEMGALLGTY